MSTLGEVVARAREAAGLSLRDLGTKVGCSPQFLCDVEKGRRIPEQRILRSLARWLALDGDDLEARAGRLAPDVDVYLREHPALAKILKRIASAKLSDDQLRALGERVGDWLA